MGDGEGAERAGFVGGSFSSSGESGSASLNPLSQGHSCHLLLGAALPSANSLRLPVPPRERAAAPQFLGCDITELCSPEALNGVFVTVCGMFQMLRGPHY